jgi:excinuclease ABC subunit C
VVRQLLRTIRKIYPYRDCSDSKFSRHSKVGKHCLYGSIGLCQAPCVNKSDRDIKNYKFSVLQIKKLLSGNSSKLVNSLEKKMSKESKELRYEDAATTRDLLNKLYYVRQSFRSAEEYIDNPYLKDDIAEIALKSLVENIELLKEKPSRIECYDISNISGKGSVGSMVVATNGKIDKDEYKRFKIRTKDTPDDFDMIFEVLYRRLKHEKKDNKNWPRPDLLVVDGGKGQVSAALAALKEYKLEIPIIGLAKKFETIVYKDKNDFKEINLEKRDPGLLLLIRLRDESHRFAQAYHHKLRANNLRA